MILLMIIIYVKKTGVKFDEKVLHLFTYFKFYNSYYINFESIRLFDCIEKIFLCIIIGLKEREVWIRKRKLN